jgi:ABC-2 type transport system permease protein
MVLGVAVLSSRWVVRQPAWLVQDALMVAAFGLILWAWGGIEAVKSVVIGWIVAGAWGAGINGVGQEVGWSRVQGTLQMFIASPLTPRAYFLGVLLGSTIFVIPVELAIVSLLAYAMGAPSLVLAALVAGLLLTPISTLLGLSIAMRIKRPTNISAITNPVTSVLILLPPVFYPALALPEPLRLLAIAVPTGAAAELSRAMAGYYNAFSYVEPLAVLVAWAAIAIVLASRTIRWGHE